MTPTPRSSGLRGDDYEARLQRIAATGKAMHGEADFVQSFNPTTVLDAGCGTGRVAIELAGRGIDVVGTDIDPAMLATARSKSTTIEWTQADLTSIDLDRTFDVVIAAGNVMIFVAPGTEAEVVRRLGAHVRPGGVLVVGFQLARSLSAATYKQHCEAAGLHLDATYATWDRDPTTESSEYLVAVHRRPVHNSAA